MILFVGAILCWAAGFGWMIALRRSKKRSAAASGAAIDAGEFETARAEWAKWLAWDRRYTYAGALASAGALGIGLGLSQLLTN